MTGAARGGGSRRIRRRARFRAYGSLERRGIRRHGEQQGDSGEHRAGRHGEPGGQSQTPRQVFHACLPFGVLRRIGDPGPAPRAARRWQRAEQSWQSDGRRLDCTPDGLYSPAMSRRIAIVEVDRTIRANYAEALRKHVFEVAAYAARAEALAAMSARCPDVALIGIGLGADIDGGFTLCRELRARSAALPIIFLTARDSDFDIVSGLQLGADDYLTKGTSLPHLLARIAALFRRAEVMRAPPASEDVLERGPLKLDLKRLQATWSDAPVALTLTEFWMVHALAKFPGHVKDRDTLMRESNLVVDDGTITSHIKRIRKKFLAVAPQFDHIDTVYGMGYRWNAGACRT